MFFATEIFVCYGHAQKNGPFVEICGSKYQLYVSVVMITKVGYFDIYFVLVCPEFLKTLKNIISMNKNEIVEILRTFCLF